MPTVQAVPTKDEILLSWSLNFKTLLSATPANYFMSAGQATTYSTAHAAFAAALTTAITPATRTKGSIAAKDTAKDALLILARGYSKMIGANPQISDQLKIDIGVNVRARPQPIPAPTATPVVEFVSVVGNTVRVKLKDNEGSKRGKPVGVAGASIFSAVSSVAPTEPSAFRFEGNTSKPIIDIVFPNTVAPGSRVWICAFWFSAKMESGPSCAPVGVFLQGGVVPMAA